MKKSLRDMTDEELEADIARFERWRFRARIMVVCVLVLKIIVLVTLLCLYGCAALPMPFQPANEQYNSNVAEGSWLVLDGVDTLQTMHLTEVRNPTGPEPCNHEDDPLAAAIYGGRYPSPHRVLLTNIALATVHTMVTSWLDDEVAKHDTLNDGSVGPWYVGRVAWHAVSLAYSGAAVINNSKHGCRL